MDRNMLIEIATHRAWLIGITCPKEELSARIAGVVVCFGMKQPGLDVAARRSIHLLVKQAIKKKDAMQTHPFPHLPVLPSDPQLLGADRLHFAYRLGGPVGAVDPELLTTLSLYLLQTGKRSTHSSYRSAVPTPPAMTASPFPAAPMDMQEFAMRMMMHAMGGHAPQRDNSMVTILGSPGKRVPLAVADSRANTSSSDRLGDVQLSRSPTPAVLGGSQSKVAEVEQTDRQAALDHDTSATQPTAVVAAGK